MADINQDNDGEIGEEECTADDKPSDVMTSEQMDAEWWEARYNNDSIKLNDTNQKIEALLKEIKPIDVSQQAKQNFDRIKEQAEENKKFELLLKGYDCFKRRIEHLVKDVPLREQDLEEYDARFLRNLDPAKDPPSFPIETSKSTIWRIKSKEMSNDLIHQDELKQQLNERNDDSRVQMDLLEGELENLTKHSDCLVMKIRQYDNLKGRLEESVQNGRTLSADGFKELLDNLPEL